MTLNKPDSPFSNKSINLDIGIRCTLKCPGCARQNAFEDIRPIPGHDMTLDEYRKIAEFFPEILMCGQVSDPVFNPNLIEFVKTSRKLDNYLGIHTAASHKSLHWYEQAFASFGRGYWMFGIDGLPEESHKYRINQDGEKLFEIAKMCAATGISTKWQYIVFRYNEDHIHQAKQMAADHGIEFLLVKSSRFGKEQDQLKYKPTKTEYYLERA